MTPVLSLVLCRVYRYFSPATAGRLARSSTCLVEMPARWASASAERRQSAGSAAAPGPNKTTSRRRRARAREDQIACRPGVQPRPDPRAGDLVRSAALGPGLALPDGTSPQVARIRRRTRPRPASIRDARRPRAGKRRSLGEGALHLRPAQGSGDRLAVDEVLRDLESAVASASVGQDPPRRNSTSSLTIWAPSAGSSFQ